MEVFFYHNGYDSKYDRTIVLAYRGNKRGKQITYNHYESVCEITIDTLYDCSSTLAGRHLNNENAIIL